MTARKTSVRVTIMGEEYALRTESSADETHAIAEYVDAAVTRVMDSGNVVDTRKAAILACLSVTAELFASRARAAETAEEIAALGAEIRPWLPPAKRHD